MRLNFLTPDNKRKFKDALIGKTGVIRFTKDFASRNKLIKNEYYILGVDEEEKPLQSIYLLKTNDKFNGLKMQLINGTWLIDSKNIFEKAKIKVPVKCKIEPTKVNDLEGFLLKIMQ